MAGMYPDLTSWKMALDRDGSVVVEVSPTSKAVLQLSNSDIRTLVDHSGVMWESTNKGGSGGDDIRIRLVVIFPELRDIDAYYIAVFPDSTISNNVPVYVSTNTTNGQDGTWTQIATGATESPAGGVGDWRTNIVYGTHLAVRAIRFDIFGAAGGQSRIYAMHVYGEVAPTENPDRLAIWDAMTDQKVAPGHLDWGDVPRSSSEDRIIRVKNLSETMMASNVRVSFDIITDVTAGHPSVPGQFTVSYAGSSFTAQQNIGAIGPGTISGPITLRRVTPSNAQVGLYSPRVAAVADSWT